MNMSKERFFTLIRIFTVIELLLLLSSCGWSFPETQREPDYNYSQRQDGDPEPVELKQESNVGHGSVSRIIKKVSPSVVGISTAHLKRDSLWDDTRLVEGIGSGVIVHSTGYILTNDHVVGGNPDNISVILQNGDELEGRTLWSDPTLDLAIIKVDAVNLPAAVLGNSQQLEVGDLAIAIGTPLALQFKHTVTSGIISALNRTVQVPTERGQNFMEDLIQTDASINPGNSGGPLINANGEVIGINTIKVSSAEGIGFAIPIDVAKPVIEQIIKDGEFVTPYIGIVGFDKEIARYYKQEKDIQEGVYVVDIDERGPAYKAGLRIDDIITYIGEKKVTKMLELRSAIYSYKVGDKVGIRFLRKGKEHVIEMLLGKKPI
ncbi:MAG: trypsin-like serine protease [Clostridiales bacterium]|nr:trypsin-like serine protease [Clostridiales bacterium]